MNRFESEREAKEFLVAEIVREAERQGKPLTEVERKMLYFSETGWTLPDMDDVNEAFDREYDQATYERKVSALARAARKHAGKDGASAWSSAIRRLDEGDHYILVMADAGRAGAKAGSNSGWWGLALLVAIGLGYLAAGFVLSLFLRRSPTGSELGFFVWATAIAFVGVYSLIRFAVGGQVMEEWISRKVESISRRLTGKSPLPPRSAR